MATTSSLKVPLIRSALRSKPSNGHVAFVPPIRKLVFEYCDTRQSSGPLRDYLLNDVRDLASRNPHVEMVIRQRSQRQPILRGFYMNGRDKVIGLNGFDKHMLSEKVQLLLDSSGAKIKSLKRRTVESRTESPRGIWSGLHSHEPYKI